MSTNDERVDPTQAGTPDGTEPTPTEPTTTAASAAPQTGNPDGTEPTPTEPASTVTAAGGALTPVIVTLAVEWTPEGEFSDDEVARQREAISKAQEALVGALESCVHEVIQRYEATPQLALRLDEDCRARVEASELVTAVQEDIPDPSN